MRKLHNDGQPIRVDDRFPAVIDLLRREAGLVAAYVFGSYGTRDQTPLSDLDLALVYSPRQVPDRKGAAALTGEILGVLGQEDVSVTVLNQADPLFQFEVIARGRLLLERDGAALADFWATVFSRHADYRIDYDRHRLDYEQALRERYLGA